MYLYRVSRRESIVSSQGSIFESNAIARYVARMRRDSELCGVSFFESAQASQVSGVVW